MKALSKSKIVAYRQCHKRLWLEVHRPDLKEDSFATQANYDSGNSVGDVAQRLYDRDGNAVLIDFMQIGFEQAFIQSAELLNKRQTIFEAGMRAGGALAFADVMEPMNKRGKIKWKMIEVKGSTSVKEYYRDDVALQCYVAREQDIEIGEVKLAHLDNQWVYPGNEQYQGLLIEADLTEEALSRYEEAREWVLEAQSLVKKRKPPKIDIGPHCSDPYDCGFYDYCSKDYEFPEKPLTWLPRLQSKKLIAMIEENELSEIKDVPDELLNNIQQRVKQATLTGKTYFDQKAAKEALSQQEYPAYFLDFESTQYAVPVWKGTRPYQQVVFQYSLHKLDKNLKVSHKEFLETQGQDPQRALAEQLIKDSGNKGPVYVYFRGFESSRIKELAKLFPDLSAGLMALNERLVDLLPIARDCYYHPSQQGSWSIKKVLPALVPSLRYDQLEGIQDGGMAQEAYKEMVADKTNPKRKQEIKQQLLAYCKLDTWAMVKIWEVFSGNQLER